jgi:hypothetical protein
VTTPDHTRGWPATVCRACAALLVALFLASVARFYHPDFGFTGLIGFGLQHEYELPAVQAVPHRHYVTGGYDGQFYAQLAVEPLLKDPAIDRALDSPPYRARRILFSWTAYALGLGRPAWILQAYALQNVICWLLLAWLLTRWMPVSTARGLALWTACLWNQGLLGSVRLSLVDGPSVLLIASAMAAVERGRPWLASATLGLAGIARETNLLAVVGLETGTVTFLQNLKTRPKRSWFFETVRFCKKVSVPVFLTLTPLLIWQDYLWAIYRDRAFAGQNQLTVPFVAFAHKWSASLQGLWTDGFLSGHMLALLALVSLTTQTVYLCVRRTWWVPWWRVAFVFAALMLTVHQAVWDGFPGAVMRVVLPLTIGFNVLLSAHAGRRFWTWYVLGNVQLAYALTVLRP